MGIKQVAVPQAEMLEWPADLVKDAKLLNVSMKHNLLESLVYGFGSAVGFSLILILFAAMRERMEGADIPESFKGAPIAFVTAGLMSLAFMGFAGLVK